MAQKVQNPATGTSYDLTNPRSLVMKVAGGIVAFTIMLWSFFVASNKGVPLMNSVVSIIPGVDLTSDGSGTDNLLGEL
jgi:hypothetical protein